MKKDFFDQMFKLMAKNKDIYLIFVGLGYPRYDEFKAKFKERAINTEASEQTALDIAVGLAYSGKIPFVYTITPFLYRGFETIRTYINHEKLNIKLIGAGRDDDYKDDGFSHDASDIGLLFGGKNKMFTNIQACFPERNEDLPDIIKTMLMHKKPYFLSLRR